MLDDAEGGLEGRRLRRREEIQPVEEGTAELVERRERNLYLGFDAVCACDGEVGCRGRRVLEQRGLADPRLADEDEGLTRSGPGTFQQILDAVLLRSSSKQHRAIVSDCASGHKTRDFPGASARPLAHDGRT